MQAKLTLRLEEDLIEHAKLVAKNSGKSLSQLVADYFLRLSQETQSLDVVPPITASLKGVLAQTDAMNEQDYRDYLEQKYS